ncbi:hypothetical protein Tco_0363188 [Tanacetum coccineum]
MSKKQDCTAMSSAEAEYVALSASYAQVMWMRTQLKDYGFNYNKIPLYCDSQSAIAISCNPVQHSRTKHNSISFHQGTDRFKYLVRRIGIRCLTPAELEVIGWWRYPIPAEVGFITTCSCSNYKDILLASRFKNQESSSLKTKTFANSDIQELVLRYKVYQGRLLASFQDDAKYEHVGQDTRSQGGKDDQDKQGKDLEISEQKTTSKDNDKGSRSKIAKHEGTILQQRQRLRSQYRNDKSNLIDPMKECHNELTSGEIVRLKY